MTPSIDQTVHQFANLLPIWTLLLILTLLPNFGGFHRTSQRVQLSTNGRLLLRTPGPVPFGTCICSNVETILSWTRHVYGPFEFRTSLGTFILLTTLKHHHRLKHCSFSYIAANEIMINFWYSQKDKKGEIWLSPITKAPTSKEISKKQRDNIKNGPTTSITQRLRTDLGRSVVVTTAAQQLWLVYERSTFKHTAKEVY